jgi:hypothetical protein
MASTMDPRNPKILPKYGVPQIVQNAAEANAQSFKAGQYVYSNAGAVTISSETSPFIWGIALTDATTVSSGNIDIPVQLLTSDCEVQMKVSSDSTIANFQAANTTCAQGVTYDMAVASSICFIDSSDTSSGGFAFIDAIYDADGTASEWGRFTPLAAVVQATVGS